ncbi:MAG TPA: MFS transporter [Ilumatobacteraceae bacterium]|nr:MFS transporter [Ilumatobacteraceae bacterium]
MSSTEAASSGTRRRRLALATWGLFAGLAFVMLAGGLFGTLLGVRSERSGLPTGVSSLIAASYYVGFLIGSRLTLAGLGRVGHIRVYTALASVLAAAIAAVGITDAAAAWSVLRLVTGVCTAGLYVVAESWLNGLATNQNRGRLLAVYGIVTVLFFGVGQMLLFAFDQRLVMGFAVASIITSVAVAPVALSEAAVAPRINVSERLSLRELAKTVPTGVFSCLLVGVAHGAISGMAAIYATRVGLSAAQIGLFVALPSLGGVLLQWPVSAASDDLDRRAVGFVASAAAALVAALLLLGDADEPMAFALICLLGGLSYPLYSIAGAYTNDWIEPEHLNAAASQLVMLYGLGAVAGPFVAAAAMVAFGPEGFYWALVGLHGLLALFFFYRMLAWRMPLAKRPWSEVSLPARAFFVPATIIGMGIRWHRGRRE